MVKVLFVSVWRLQFIWGSWHFAYHMIKCQYQNSCLVNHVQRILDTETLMTLFTALCLCFSYISYNCHQSTWNLQSWEFKWFFRCNCFPQALAFIPPVRDFFLREENYQNIKRPPGDIMFPLGTGIACLSTFWFLEVVHRCLLVFGQRLTFCTSGIFWHLWRCDGGGLGGCSCLIEMSTLILIFDLFQSHLSVALKNYIQ